jgi:hypothetical protein
VDVTDDANATTDALALSRKSTASDVPDTPIPPSQMPGQQDLSSHESPAAATHSIAPDLQSSGPADKDGPENPASSVQDTPRPASPPGVQATAIAPAHKGETFDQAKTAGADAEGTATPAATADPDGAYPNPPAGRSTLASAGQPAPVPPHQSHSQALLVQRPSADVYVVNLEADGLAKDGARLVLDLSSETTRAILHGPPEALDLLRRYEAPLRQTLQAAVPNQVQVEIGNSTPQRHFGTGGPQGQSTGSQAPATEHDYRLASIQATGVSTMLIDMTV